MNPADRLETIYESLLDLADQLSALPVRHPVAKAALRKVQQGLLDVMIDLHRAELAEGFEHDRPAQAA